MAIDGFEWDVPDTAANAGAFGYAAGSEGRSAFPKVRVVSLSECGSHAMVAAEISGRAGTGEQALARRLYPRLEPDWLVIADRNFYSFTDWQRAAATGAQLLWRVKRSRRLPVLGRFADGSFASILITPQARPDRGRRYQRILDAARAGRELDPDEAMLVRVIEYEVPHDTPGAGAGDPIRLITTIVDPAQASAGQLAQAYHERWEHETGNGQIKTYLRGPGRVLRSKSPDLVRAEIYGYLLTHYAISALICQAATEAGIDPDRIKFTRTVRIVRRSLADPAAFPPDQHKRSREAIIEALARPRNLNPPRRHRSYPRVVKRRWYHAYRVKQPNDHGTRHHGPPTIKILNQAA